MNEVTKEYYSEIASRSITAKSARAKNGNNYEKLGSKQLTRKEIEEKHGPVKTYTFDDFLTFSEFREMPTDWQAGYINHLQDKYDIGLVQINRDLFGARDDNQLRSHLKLKGILNDCHPEKKRGRTKLHEFRSDIREYRRRPVVPEIESEPVEKPLPMFLNWTDFKALGHVQQQIFVKRLLDEYNLGLKTINAELFNSNNTNFHGYLVQHGFDMAKDFGIKRGGYKKGKEHNENLARFRRDIAEWRKSKICSETDGTQHSCIVFNPDTQSYSNLPEPSELKAQLDQSIQKLNDRAEKGETITANDVYKELGIEPVPEEKNVVIAKPPVFKTKQKVFSASYIGNDFNMAEIEVIRKMFAGQKIQVEITVTTDSIMDKYE